MKVIFQQSKGEKVSLEMETVFLVRGLTGCKSYPDPGSAFIEFMKQAVEDIEQPKD